MLLAVVEIANIDSQMKRYKLQLVCKIKRNYEVY